MLTVTLVGKDTLDVKLGSIPARLHQKLLRKFFILANEVKMRVRQKLSGEVLNVQTGALRRSINSKVEDSGAQITAIVYQSGDVKYGKIHEFGGDIVPVKSQYLHFQGKDGNWVMTKRVHIPARPYMIPTLNEMEPHIVETLQLTVREGLLERP